MLSINGQQYIKRYLAGQVGQIASVAAFGIGDSTESTGSTRLDAEIYRSDINLISYDFVADKLIFRATLASNLIAQIREVALFSSPADTDIQLISGFDSATETWSAGTWATSNVRVGADGLFHTSAMTSVLDSIYLDLSGTSSSDVFKLACFCSATTTVTIKFLTNISNYYSIAFSAATGYNILSGAKSTATVTGTPDWANITSISVTSAGAGNTTFDLLSFEQQLFFNPEIVLVDRSVLGTPYVKVQGHSADMEVAIPVTFT